MRSPEAEPDDPLAILVAKRLAAYQLTFLSNLPPEGEFTLSLPLVAPHIDQEATPAIRAVETTCNTTHGSNQYE